jgi:hypoxia up-regulated 1
MIFRTLLCLALLFAASAQVIGIDFGTEYWKSAIISPGKSFVIVENSKSERKTHNAVISSSNLDRFY